MSATISDKDVEVIPHPKGTVEVPIDSERRRRPCLDENSISKLFELATACETLLGGPQDIEWATALNKVWLLQSRPITSTLYDRTGRS